MLIHFKILSIPEMVEPIRLPSFQKEVPRDMKIMKPFLQQKPSFMSTFAKFPSYGIDWIKLRLNSHSY